jgi:hypothetical protein
MQRKSALFVGVAVIAVSLVVPVSAEDVLTGDPRLACEAILCLASGTRPPECASSLSRYFSISFRDWRDTVKGRVNFLNQCPAANQTAEMASLVSAMSVGAGSCDAQSLNWTLRQWRWNPNDSGNNAVVVYIGNTMPGVCSAYTGHQYTYDLAPKYVGTPEREGYWVDSKDYAAALEAYNARIAAEDAQNQMNGGRQNYWWGNNQ